MEIDRMRKILEDFKDKKQTEKIKDKYRYIYKDKYKSIKESYPFTIDDVHKKFTDEQLLNSIDIEKIELYLRQKKLNKLKDNMKK